MTTQTEEKILDRLERIEHLLIRVIPNKTELTEDEVLEIIKEGEQEYKEGKTKNFDLLIQQKYPHLLKNEH